MPFTLISRLDNSGGCKGIWLLPSTTQSQWQPFVWQISKCCKIVLKVERKLSSVSLGKDILFENWGL